MVQKSLAPPERRNIVGSGGGAVSVGTGGCVAGSVATVEGSVGADVAGALGAQAEIIRTNMVTTLKAKYRFDMVVSPLA